MDAPATQEAAPNVSSQPESGSQPAERKPIHSLVIDTGPIIKNDPPVSSLLAQAEELYTIPSVISEIRDEETRSRLQATLLPFLKVRSPRPESIKFVSDFARKTGDLEVLSRPDIHVIALTYELECERNGGDWRLRKTPTQRGVNGKPPVNGADEAGSHTTSAPTDAGDSTQEPSTDGEPASKAPVEATEEVSSVVDKVQDLTLEPEEAAPSGQQDAAAGAADQEGDGDGEGGSDDSDDSDGWITATNLKKHQEKHQGDAPAQPIQKTLQAAILTSDYAMQNVCLRMNLNLLNPSLMRITRVKTWVLRCHGCFTVTRKMDKQFCPSCGQATLTRTSCSTDQTGSFRVHLKRNYQYNKRGNVYSVPKPVHGSASGKNTHVNGGGKNQWGRELILAEDQKEYVKHAEETQRTKYRDLMDEDYLPNVLTGERSGQRRIRIGAGRSVNSKKR